MAKFDIFIGRYKELEQIRFWADKSGTVHHILVEGPGGVGKTFLLQKVMQEYLGKDGFAIDYYDLQNSLPVVFGKLYIWLSRLDEITSRDSIRNLRSWRKGNSTSPIQVLFNSKLTPFRPVYVS